MTINGAISTRKFAFISGIWIFLMGLIRYFHRPYGLDFDGAEQTYLSQWLELGSGIQPPLPTWIFHFVFDWFGHSVAWVHAIRLFFIFLIYLGFYRLSLKLLKTSQLALICTLSLVFIFQFSSVMLKQMHTVFITLSVIYSWLCLLNIHESNRLKSYLWLGFWIGVGFLSKYNFIIHIGALLIATLSLPQLRTKILNPKIIICAFIAFAICSPHYFWLLDNFESVSQGVNKDLTPSAQAGHLENIAKGLGSLMLKTLAFGGALIFVFLAFFFTPFRTNLNTKEPPFFQLMMRYMTISYLALILVIITTRANIFHEHWLQPFFLIFPILLFQKLKGNEATLSKKFNVLKYLCLSVFLIISVDFAFKSHVKILSGHPRSVFNIPYKGMADSIRSYALNCEAIITQDPITAGHMKMLIPDKLVLVDNDLSHMTKESQNILNAHTMAYTWRINDSNYDPPIKQVHFTKVFGEDIKVEILDSINDSSDFAFRKNDPYSFGIAKISVSVNE